jgi:maltose phosphorylase
LEDQKKLGQKLTDITIEGDVKAQQGIRFNIFQLNQTYLGKDSRLNIGPKGFTGEKYGGSTLLGYGGLLYSFYMAKRPTSCSKFIDVPLQPVG